MLPLAQSHSRSTLSMTTRLPISVIKFELARHIPFGGSKSPDYARLPCHIYARCSPPSAYRFDRYNAFQSGSRCTLLGSSPSMKIPRKIFPKRICSMPRVLKAQFIFIKVMPVKCFLYLFLYLYIFFIFYCLNFI